MECEAAVSLIFNDDKFLLIKRSEQKNDPWSGQMALPGGHREISETCEETAIRETFEEVNLKIKINRFIGIYYTLNNNLSVAAFEAFPLNSNVVIDKEISKYFWVGFDELEYDNLSYLYNDYVIFGLTYRILNDYIRNLNP